MHKRSVDTACESVAERRSAGVSADEKPDGGWHAQLDQIPGVCVHPARRRLAGVGDCFDIVELGHRLRNEAGLTIINTVVEFLKP